MPALYRTEYSQSNRSTITIENKTPCLGCKKHPGPIPLSCKTCGRMCHQQTKCSGIPTRDTIKTIRETRNWESKVCKFKQRPPDQPPDSQEAISQKSEPKFKTKLNRPLRILQWNAEGINPKWSEFCGFLKEYQIDIALIQESQLLPRFETQTVKGYEIKRGDPIGAEFPGGGLLSIISKNISVKESGFCNRNGVEHQSFFVHLTGKKWITVNNLYCPGKDELDLSWIPVDNNSIFAGDFNGHSQIWDHIQPTDDRGEKIVDWVIQRELQCVNDGSPTRINRATGGLSTPDITLVTSGLQTKTKWTTVKDTSMGSDHQPIIIELHEQTFKPYLQLL